MASVEQKKRKATDDLKSIDNAKRQKTSTDDVWETKLGGGILLRANIRVSYTDATGKHGKTFQMKDYDMNEAKTRQAANAFIKENKLDSTKFKVQLNNCCELKIKKEGKIYRKYFAFSKYGGREQALAAAKKRNVN